MKMQISEMLGDIITTDGLNLVFCTLFLQFSWDHIRGDWTHTYMTLGVWTMSSNHQRIQIESCILHPCHLYHTRFIFWASTIIGSWDSKVSEKSNLGGKFQKSIIVLWLPPFWAFTLDFITVGGFSCKKPSPRSSNCTLTIFELGMNDQFGIYPLAAQVKSSISAHHFSFPWEAVVTLGRSLSSYAGRKAEHVCPMLQQQRVRSTLEMV